MLRVVHDSDAHMDVGPVAESGAGSMVDLDELCRLAAREMIAVALDAERRAYLEAHAHEADAAGKRMVVGNGYAREREITTAAGRVEVRAPRVDDRRDGERFGSAILPPYMRRSPKVTEVLPILYLRGLSTGDFAPALKGFFGSDAGLSASTVQRLTEASAARRGYAMRLSCSRVTLVLLTAAALLAAIGSPATAWTHHGCKFDNNSISPIQYQFQGVGSSMQTINNNAQAEWDRTSSPRYFDNNQVSFDPEIPIFDGEYAGGWWGLTTWRCDGDGTYSGNEVSSIKYDMDGLGAAAKERVAMHEFGHAYGLGHTNTGCRIMRADPVNDSCGISAPSTNDVDGVQARY